MYILLYLILTFRIETYSSINERPETFREKHSRTGHAFADWKKRLVKDPTESSKQEIRAEDREKT